MTIHYLQRRVMLLDHDVSWLDVTALGAEDVGVLRRLFRQCPGDIMTQLKWGEKDQGG